jgi:hypothetical protein
MNESENGAPGSGGALKIHPPTLAAALLIAGLLLHLLGRSRHAFVHPHLLIGLLMVAGGVALMAHAAALFVARGTTKKPAGEPTSLVLTPPWT